MLEPEARQLFLRHNPYPGDGLPNHCLRLRDLTLALARHRGFDADADLVAAAAWLHDIGLLVDDPEESRYLPRGLRYCEPYMDAWGVTGEARRELSHMLLYNHALHVSGEVAPTAEILRRAVQVEHSRGLIRNGLSRGEVKRIFREHPRGNFNKVLADFTRIAVFKDGVGTLLPTFFPSGGRR
jgi:hypothetical protein